MRSRFSNEKNERVFTCTWARLHRWTVAAPWNRRPGHNRSVRWLKSPPWRFNVQPSSSWSLLTKHTAVQTVSHKYTGPGNRQRELSFSLAACDLLLYRNTSSVFLLREPSCGRRRWLQFERLTGYNVRWSTGMDIYLHRLDVQPLSIAHLSATCALLLSYVVCFRYWRHIRETRLLP